MGCCDGSGDGTRENPSGPITRRSCIQCVRKHLGAAYVLITEARSGYSHELMAIGHLHEAEDESQEFRALHAEIRHARKGYMEEDAMPDWELLGRMVAAEMKRAKAEGRKAKQPENRPRPAKTKPAAGQTAGAGVSRVPTPPPVVFIPGDGGPAQAGLLVDDPAGGANFQPLPGVTLKQPLTSESIEGAEGCYVQPLKLTLENGRIVAFEGPGNLTRTIPTSKTTQVYCRDSKTEDHLPCED